MKKPTKQQLLLEWIKRHKLVSSAMILKYGLENYFISAHRRAQEMVECGTLRKVDSEHIRNMGLSTKMAWYEPA